MILALRGHHVKRGRKAVRQSRDTGLFSPRTTQVKFTTHQAELLRF